MSALTRPVGAAKRRETAPKRAHDISGATAILGLLRSPFATQGRSYESRCPDTAGWYSGCTLLPAGSSKWKLRAPSP
jgi:hypothetical protein